MAANNNIFSREWCEMVFDKRYRDYGGFELRTQSSRRLFRALIWTVVVIVLIVTSPLLVNRIFPKKIVTDKTVRVLSDIQIDRPQEENILREIPPPPVELRNMVKFVAPVVQSDEQVTEEPPKTQHELLEQKSEIGTTTVTNGTDDVAAPVADADQAKIAAEADVPVVHADLMPQFPGGEREMLRFIKMNLRYPASAQDNGVQGTVLLNFVVDREGKITNIKVIKGIGFGCDEESVRVLEKMPAWSPGKQRGQPVL
ncbi:MAG: TonB family protein, partial [Marinilabiliales bacterium]|nr:TonB family protein [Marinilabiliales bacterium]